jgi:hypothetical protein
MTYYIVLQEGDSSKYAVIGAEGFVPTNSLGVAPDGATTLDSDFIKLVDGKFILDAAAKTAEAQRIELIKQQELEKMDATNQALSRIKTTNVGSLTTITQIRSALADVITALNLK